MGSVVDERLEQIQLMKELEAKSTELIAEGEKEAITIQDRLFRLQFERTAQRRILTRLREHLAD